MFEHIVVIVDGSKTSYYAIDASITIAREMKSSIVFCITVDPDLFGEGIGVVSFAEMAVMDCRRLLEEAINRAKSAGIENVTGHILANDPVHAVVETARTYKSDFIMMGLAPKVGILRPFMRSLAEEILDETAIPLCVMRRPARGWLSRRILIPIVNDPIELVAVEHAIQFALELRSTLIFCSVESSSDNTALRQALQIAKETAVARGVIIEELLLESENGIPKTIANIADIAACDSIMMATHLRTGFPRLIEGSVSAAVTYASDVPVILVRKAM